MNDSSLYHQIAEAVRQEILHKTLQPGDRLPSVREMATRWNCTNGTVQRAYQELSHQGLVISRPGQGTRIMTALPPEEITPLRRATLVHRAEAFLLEAFTSGYSQPEVEQSIRLALDRWRTVHKELNDCPESTLRFVGSHDPAISLITARFAEVAPAYVPQLSFAGSLGGLIALAEGEAELAGAHLWDEESDTYNLPFVRRLLPGRRVVLLTLAHRHLGLIVSPSNPAQVEGLNDLARSGIRFVNRQRGTGTRVWLDAQLRRIDLNPAQISGYKHEVSTHSDMAHTIAEGKADVGLGVQAAAVAYGLDFLALTKERYDLVIPAEVWERPSVQALASWLATDEVRASIEALGGYDVNETGRIAWLNN